MRLVYALAAAALACSSRGQPAPATAPPAFGPSAEGVDMPVNRLAHATVYDEAGRAGACEPPERDCSSVARDADFLDRCRLAGYQVRRCGCRMVCSGKVTAPVEHYDANGAVRSCAPEAADCTPPETSARFQDACEEAGHKLVVCGCEWLCNGRPKAR